MARGVQSACSLPCFLGGTSFFTSELLYFKSCLFKDRRTPRFTHTHRFLTSLHCPCSGCAFHSYPTTYPEGWWGGPLSPAHLTAPAPWLAKAPAPAARCKRFPLASYSLRFISSHNALGRERRRGRARALALQASFTSGCVETSLFSPSPFPSRLIMHFNSIMMDLFFINGCDVTSICHAACLRV